MNAPGSSQTPENLQQMKKLMEQELKSEKFKSNSNKGYVFTLMPLYAIGVGVFAAYKFLKVNKDDRNIKLHKAYFWWYILIGMWRVCITVFLFNSQIKSADDQAQKDNIAKGAKKSAEAGVFCMQLDFHLYFCVFCVQALRIIGWWDGCPPFVLVCLHTENQLNELEQRLAQTERMLNSILTQLDPLTNWLGMIFVCLHAMWFSSVNKTPCYHTLCKQCWLKTCYLCLPFFLIEQKGQGYLFNYLLI